MENIIKELLNIISNIKYGYLDDNNQNILDYNPDWDFSNYHLLSPEELLEKKYGVCWDFVELERSYLEKTNIPFKTYFICTYDGENLPSHTFLTYKLNNKYYWLEGSWKEYFGSNEYDDEITLLKSVKEKFLNSHEKTTANTFIFEYQKPNTGITCEEMYSFCEKGKLMKLNEPLYFYHLVNKDANLEKGILSLQYMYDHKMFDLFDNYTSKYEERITSLWDIPKYQNKEKLTREEYLDALTTFRGEKGPSYIYFFKYPLYKELGPKIEELLKYKDIYKININDEEIQRNIINIFYGYDRSNSDNKLLDKNYYEEITEEEYFKYYDDNAKINFSNLNHIGIVFKDDYCPINYLEKIN